MVKLVDGTYGDISIESQRRPELYLTRFQSLQTEQLKSKVLIIFRGEEYLEDLLYFYFGMQLGINLCEAINVQITLSMM